MIKDFHNFGKFYNQARVHTYESGVEGEDPIRTPYYVLVNDDGVEWHDLVSQHGPFDYYIALSDAGVIFSMESDADASQIPNNNLVGIKVSEAFNYTRGPGGTVYGKIWNGVAIVEPEPEPEPIPDEISRRQFFQQLAVMEIITKADALAAMQGGIIPTPLQAIIDQLPTDDDRFDAQMFIVGAQNFHRLHPLSETVRLSLAWTLEQKDAFWRDAAKL